MSEYATVRSVQSIKGSYALYLPKKWCEKNNVSKGSEILLLNLGGSLLVTPKTKFLKIMANIPLDNISLKELEIFMHAAYVEGFEAIKIIKEGNFSTNEKYFIGKILKRLLGMNIIYESDNELLIKEIAPLGEVFSLIERCFQLVEVALNHLAPMLRETYELKIIGDVEGEIDKINLAIQRKVHRILSFKEVLSKVDYIEAVHYTQITKYLERIADHIKELAEEIHENERVIIPESLFKEILKLHSKCFRSFKERNMRGAVEVILLKEVLRDKITNKIDDKTVLIHLVRIVDYLSDISEILVDIMLKDNFMVKNDLRV